MRSGVLERAINRYKYEGRCGWALIFGRVLAGYINAHRKIFSGFDLIVGSPTFVSTGGRREWDHIRGILDKASDQFEPGEWPLDLGDPTAIIQTAETPRFAGLNWQQRRGIATGVLRSSLFVPDPNKTRNRKILVFDDVFTEGLRMNEVARALKEQGGAVAVSGVVLARQQYRSGK